MPENIPYTLLSLDRYAKIMGINPAHFWTAIAPDLTPEVFPLKNSCSDVWPHYSWQLSDHISHYDLAFEIQNAEQDIADYLSYYPAPMWISNEVHNYPRHYQRNSYGDGLNVRGQIKSIRSKYAKVVDTGKRATSLLGTPEVVYSDEDGDNLHETATVTLVVDSTLNVDEIDLYFAGYDGNLEWQVREIKKSLTGDTFTAVLDSWLLIKPKLREKYPNYDGFEAINISTTANFVETVDVYRQYIDRTDYSSQFYWEKQPGINCGTCSQNTQTGCLDIRDVNYGILVPKPSNYNSDLETWQVTDWIEGREPDQVKIWYYAGSLSDSYLNGFNYKPLSNHMAQIIAYMATARLERPFCNCGNVTALANRLMDDYSVSTKAESRFTQAEDLLNPFGTHFGEIWAWRRLSKLKKKIQRGFAA